MRLLKRNCTEFEYYAYTGLDSDEDENGLHTGVWKPVYEDPVTYKGNISVPSGTAVQAFDGIETRYTHVLLMDDVNTPIDEAGLIDWNGSTYMIRAVRPSLNVLAIALKKKTDGG